jgi:hypothetical protein
MALNKKDYVDFMNLRLGEYAYNKQNMYATELLPVNGLIYNKIVNHKSFYIINSVMGILLFKKAGGINKNNLKSFLIKFLPGSFLNYNIFYRSYKNEYPFILEDKSRLEKYQNNFERVLNSLIDPLYILQKDNFILTIIFLFCLPYNAKTSNDLTTNKNEIEIKEIQIKENIKEEKNKITSVIDISEQQPIQVSNNVRTEKIKAGKFL